MEGTTRLSTSRLLSILRSGKSTNPKWLDKLGKLSDTAWRDLGLRRAIYALAQY